MKFSINKVPKRISPCPIREAVFEIRYNTSIPSEVIPGLLYQGLAEKFPEIQNLPILDMPESIRNNEASLTFAPHYSFKGDGYKFQVGPKSASLVCCEPYAGWGDFKDNINFILRSLGEANVIKEVTRTGLRYINVFKNTDVFESLNIQISIAGNDLIGNKNVIRSDFPYQDYRCIVQTSNDALDTLDDTSVSLLDIDVIRDISSSQKPNYEEILLESHKIEKEIFFSMLNDKYKKNLKIEY